MTELAKSIMYGMFVYDHASEFIWKSQLVNGCDKVNYIMSYNLKIQPSYDEF